MEISGIPRIHPDFNRNATEGPPEYDQPEYSYHTGHRGTTPSRNQTGQPSVTNEEYDIRNYEIQYDIRHKPYDKKGAKLKITTTRQKSHYEEGGLHLN